ncbi:toll/interleukin-1 receptor domain-containing protein [Robiginitalea sp. M366]|uniref:toll/interleukin-1 receptor domain-containing protein n=1 Tax=Robiginitalea aestuariiviva TaxID=3036903 RepID=UPI00240DE4CC|nr:toll/interleukin-1 receptor domain-containing protein [Robiginitalea aestuariiviva]MDG1571162.1 toll/interleukin-1 receptor domain-containing protein [Robiginitalea aestuariiviva]
MNEATLQRIIKRINEGQCLVILGPQLLSPDGTGIHTLLNQHLTETLGSKVRCYDDQEFISFDAKTRELLIEDEVSDFFEGLQANDLYRKIADIPFPLIINTAPDVTLNQILKEKGIGFDYDFYHKGRAPKEPAKTQARYLYNIFGDHRELDSMILTYRDLYEYLHSIMGDNGLKIKSLLRESKTVLFFGFSFDKWYFQLLLWLMQIEDKLLNSHDINQESIKHLYHEEFDVEFFENSTAAEIIDALHKALEAGQIQEPEAQKVAPTEIYISYAWKGASEEMANLIETTLQANEIHLVRDKNDLGYKGGITEFMNRIGQAKGVVVIVSDKYLKSGYCMYELSEIYRHADFEGRIFPIVLEDAMIFDVNKRLEYKQEWKQKLDALDEEIKRSGAEALQTIGAEYEKFKRIYDDFDRIINKVSDMNVLTPDIHKSTHFEDLIKAIRQNT